METGTGWHPCFYSSYVSPFVSTLPIRNGNTPFFLLFFIYLSFCKYLTYKEWKQNLSVLYFKNCCVSTLPIRNGNSRRVEPSENLDYESKYLTYKEWKRFLRCYPTSLPSYVIIFTINNIQICYIYSIFISSSNPVVYYLNKIKNSSIIQCYLPFIENIFISI